ncbi:hypothetical protein ACIPY5_04025 [Microbacterium sp. NPDC089698]|uniref:hypothetical protein n=1 Tax=Microbacterium sp. NPDC089698 TaxID=3364200 RepID=UPI003803E2A6
MTSPTATAPAEAATPPTPSTSVPAETAALAISLDHITAFDASGSETGGAKLADPAAVVTLMTKALGAPTSQEHHSDAPGYTLTKWDGVLVRVPDGSSGTRIIISSAASGGVALRSASGISVGMSRDAAVAAGATPTVTFTDPAGSLHEILTSERTDRPGTTSLVSPGQTGSVYVEHEIVDGAVRHIVTPGDDFSDL